MPQVKEKVDTLIIGQGLAGTVLALQMQALDPNHTLRIIDTGSGNTSSRAALGILNPVTGMRFTPTWQWQTCWDEAAQFYPKMEALLRTRFFRPTPIYRLFRDEKEKRRWTRFREREGVLDWVREEFDETPPILQGHVNGELGGMVLPGGWLDIDLFLDAAAGHFRENGVLIEQRFDPADAEITADTVRWEHLQAQRIIFCEGYSLRSNPWFGDSPMALAKGQSLLIRVAQFPQDLIVIRKIFFLPMHRDDSGNGTILRIGSTWEWDDLTPHPTAEARDRLTAMIHEFSPDLEFEIVNQSGGVRPITKDKKPLVGTLPGRRNIGILNGLGAKGSLLAPHFARTLIDHLNHNTPLDPAIDPCRF